MAALLRRPVLSWPISVTLFSLVCAGAPGQRAEPEDRTARIKVLIPDDARLAVDDFESKETGAERRLVTPPLEPGRKYTYTLTAAWKDGDRKIRRMAVVVVRAGEETVVDMRPNSRDGSSSQVIYVPTPQKVVEKMLDMARVTKDDLGCSGGGVVVTAAREGGAAASASTRAASVSRGRTCARPAWRNWSKSARGTRSRWPTWRGPRSW